MLTTVLKAKKMYKKFKSIFVCILLVISFSTINTLFLNQFLSSCFEINSDDAVKHPRKPYCQKQNQKHRYLCGGCFC